MVCKAIQGSVDVKLLSSKWGKARARKGNSMRLRLSSLIFLAVCNATPTIAGPILLASYSRQGGVSEVSIHTQIGFLLTIFDFESGKPAYLGAKPETISQSNVLPIRFWDSGESGILEFNESNDVGFARFRELATDGIDSDGHIQTTWTGYSGGADAFQESILFNTATDLIGADIDLVRLHVKEVTYGMHPFFGPGWDWDYTFEFFGTPAIPEPATICLLVAGVILLTQSRKNPWRVCTERKRSMTH